MDKYVKAMLMRELKREREDIEEQLKKNEKEIKKLDRA